MYILTQFLGMTYKLANDTVVCITSPQSAQRHQSRCQAQVVPGSRIHKDYKFTGYIEASGSWLLTNVICEDKFPQ